MNRDTVALLLELVALLRSDRVQIAVAHKMECPALKEFLATGINCLIKPSGAIVRKVECACGAGVLEDERDRILGRLGIQL